MKIILGSQSQGRKNVLTQMGYVFDVVVPDIDEKAIRDSDPRKLTLKIANAKSDNVLLKVREDAIIITSDSVVVVNGKITEKPVNKEEAFLFLKAVSAGVPQILVSAVTVSNTKTGERFDGVSEATVIFNPIPKDNILKFVGSGDTFNHAGAFCVEHPFFNPFIKEIKGEMETIIGLPKALTEKLIQQASSL
ncbi:septum formation protein Maf [bacterium CG10_46_32]|nr:MAG: septum formation protein Maf [bacterium CG10_46_32]PIR55756.1 MAG: septum formation protein Maf [Parcubacteria group bacterium CG10_big_fil_rev_8_21_14_0_10_46_32]